MRGADGDVGAGAREQAGPRRHHSGGRQVPVRARHRGSFGKERTLMNAGALFDIPLKIAIIAVVIIAVVIIALFGSKKLPH